MATAKHPWQVLFLLTLLWYKKIQILTQKALLRQTFSNKFAAMTEIASGTSLPEIPAGERLEMRED